VVPKVGPSTIAALSAAAIVMAAFVTTWMEGNPSALLASISAGLTALVGVLRSWQAVSSPSKD
jgi:hypothetical protein